VHDLLNKVRLRYEQKSQYLTVTAISCIMSVCSIFLSRFCYAFACKCCLFVIFRYSFTRYCRHLFKATLIHINQCMQSSPYCICLALVTNTAERVTTFLFHVDSSCSGSKKVSVIVARKRRNHSTNYANKVGRR